MNIKIISIMHIMCNNTTPKLPSTAAKSTQLFNSKRNLLQTTLSV